MYKRRCIVIFLDVPMLSGSTTITCVRRRTFAKLLAHGGATLAMSECVHSESIESPKKPCGTVA